MNQRVHVASKLKSIDVGVAKASFKRAFSLQYETRNPSDLVMSRLNIR
jgi:hypothetical protein